MLIPATVSSEVGAGRDGLASGDEIALFTTEGTCVGAGRWEERSLAVAAAGANAQETSGYAHNEPLELRLWDASTETAYSLDVRYAPCDPDDPNRPYPTCRDDGRYQTDALYTITSLSTGNTGVAADAPTITQVTAGMERRHHVAANTLDDDFSTRWLAYGKGAWIQFDLREEVSLDRVGIAWYRGNERKAKFEIAVSADGTTWTAVHEGWSSGAAQGLEYYDFSATPTKHVRIRGHRNSNNRWTSITKVEMGRGNTGVATDAPATDDTADAPTDDPDAPATDDTADAPTITQVTAGMEDRGKVAANTRDDDLRTRWSAYGKGAWIQFDLREEVPLDQVGIAWYRGDKRQATFEIAVSADGTTWTAVHEGSSSGATQGPEYYDFPSTPTKHVRIRGRRNTENRWTSITEVKVGRTTNSASSKSLARQTVHQPIESAVPAALTLEPNYPNPVHRSTTIRYSVPQSDHVTLEVFDLLGRRVARPVDRFQSVGRHEVTLTVEQWSSGTYLYRLQAGGETQTGRMTVVR